MDTGQSLACAAGTWSGTPTGYAFRWLRDSAPIAGATGSTHVVTGADVGTELTCRVTASNAYGQGVATSAALYVGTSVAPVNTVAPAISGTPQVGRTLTCSTGSWTGSPTYSFVWVRGPAEVGGAPTYLARAADVGTSLTCTVIAKNARGSRAATSAPVLISP